MKIYESIAAFKKPHKAVVTMGIFDGVHLGHRQLLQQLCADAQEEGGEAVVVTFWPHPKLILEQSHAVSSQLLTTFNEKAALIAHLGITHLLKIEFTKDFSQLSAQDFVRQILINQVGMTRLVVGHDHRFGKDRAGNIDLLRELGHQHDFKINKLPPRMVDNVIVSSTEIRNLLLAGNVAKANTYLGRPHEIAASVLPNKTSKGQFQLTAISIYKLIPPDGLYEVQVNQRERAYEGTLRIVRRHDDPIMVLTIPSYITTTLHTPGLRIQFKKNLNLG